MSQPLYLGLDLGGTAIKAGVTDGRSRLLGQVSVPTPTGGPPAVVTALS